jgi:hypothetical protein
LRRLAWVVALFAAAVPACKESSPAGPSPTPTAAPTLAPTATPTVAANTPPVLGIRVSPAPISGAAPLTVTVNMCTCQDVDRDEMFFEYKWGGAAHKVDGFCREDHVYNTPGMYQAWFCVTDKKSEPVCKSYKVNVS